MFSTKASGKGTGEHLLPQARLRAVGDPCDTDTTRYNMTMGPTKPTASSNTLMQVLLGGRYGWIAPVPSTTPRTRPLHCPSQIQLQPLPLTHRLQPPKPAAGVAWIPSPMPMHIEYVAIGKHRRWASSVHTAATGHRTQPPHTKTTENDPHHHVNTPHHRTLRIKLLPLHMHMLMTYVDVRKHWLSRGSRPCPPPTHRLVVSVTSLTELVRGSPPTHSLHPPKRATGIVPAPPPMPMHI